MNIVVDANITKTHSSAAWWSSLELSEKTRLTLPLERI